jgi:hypothetical protein
MNNQHTVAKSFWVIAIVALLWNAMGVMAYLADVYMTAESMAAFTQAQQDVYASRPAWAVGAFALAVFAGLIGSVLLLLRSKWTQQLYIISVLALIAQNYYWFVLADALDVFPDGHWVPLMVFIIALFLLWYARSLSNKGLLK